MKDKTLPKKKMSRAGIQKMVEENLSISLPKKHYLDYLGTVNYDSNERLLGIIRDITEKKPQDEIIMTVTSPGGPTGIGMHFFDHIKYVLKPNLITIGSGDVDSSGILILLSGEKRYVTRHTTALFHLAGRTFPTGNRFTVIELESMLAEDTLKNEQYANVVSMKSDGKLSKEKVLQMMKDNTVLSAEELVECGLAEKVLE